MNWLNSDDQLKCMSTILEMTPHFVATTNRDGKVLYYNSAAGKLLDLEEREDISHVLHNDAFCTAIREGFWQGETVVVNHEGKETPISQVVIAHKTDTGNVEYFSTIARDISKQKKIGEQERLAANVLQNIIEGVVITDPNSHIVSVNRAFTDVTGYEEYEVIGKKPSILSSGKHDKQFYKVMWQDLLEHGFWKGEVWNRHKNGNHYLQKLTISAVKDDQGKTAYYVSLIEDITKKKELEEQIAFQAFHDSLTKLPNRYSFNKILEEKIQSIHGEIAILLLDLDRFKRVNDTLGHHGGDQLLCAVAERLVRKVGNKGLVSRLSGDEFIMIFPDFTEREALAESNGLLEELRHSFFIGQHEFFIGGSIGISIFPKDGTDVETLFKKADHALYRAKELGRNNAQLYHELNGQQLTELATLENSLHRALEQDQFELYYQPQLDLRSGKVVGVEALIRWNHPEQGIISPMHFIPIAEDMGIIHILDELVLRKACNQVVAWSQQGFEPIRISINVSMLNFNKNDIVTRILTTIEETRVNPEQIVLELTESAVMNNPDMTVHVLSSLKDKGIAIALDDFGTGYSSLGYLKRLPIDLLKIDRSFIRDITEEDRNAALVGTIIHLAKSLNLKVVAEGVETEEQLQLLLNYGCDEIQGYYMSKPLPKKDFEALMTKQYST